MFTVGRWEFLQGELSMQRRLSAVGRCNAGRGYRRKLQKKLMHHKQQLEDLEVAKKAFQASTQVSGMPLGHNTKVHLILKIILNFRIVTDSTFYELV